MFLVLFLWMPFPVFDEKVRTMKSTIALCSLAASPLRARVVLFEIHGRRCKRSAPTSGWRFQHHAKCFRALGRGRSRSSQHRAHLLALEGEEGYKLQGEINAAFKPAQSISYLAP